MVLAAQTWLRRKNLLYFDRRELAEIAGVTPALVSYYFRDENSLIQAAVHPIIESYLRSLQKISVAETPPFEKLRTFVTFLIQTSRLDGRLIDSYIDHVRLKAPLDAAILHEASMASSAIIRELQEAGLFRTGNVAFSQTAIWGMCRQIAQSADLDRHLLDGAMSPSELEIRQADLVIDLLVHGLGAGLHEVDAKPKPLAAKPR